MADTEYDDDERDYDELPEAVNVEGNPEPSPEEIAAARERNEKQIIEPEDDGPVDMGYDRREQDPVTARNPDPAAMSEHERNARLTEQYDPPRDA
jgi:hypothetical protein